MTVELFTRDCPRTCRNFLELAKSGYYDGNIFHRLVPDFMAQTGDPLGNGTGGESIYGPTFEDEVVAKLSHSKPGMLSMANSGRNTNASQFFLTLKACQHLDGKHTVFGHITSGMDVLEDIAKIKVDKNNRPKKPVKLFSVSVLQDPWDGQPIPEGCHIPEKPLVSQLYVPGKKAKPEQCAVQ
eukprot:CAMPEP_0117697940 /NCGR_PEP_ID=MMETSP0804-20121206/29503_1 /TAXON_ID=1074897 /ORGANISM="Tetraselmis astigmatica, Strain CCMP880" /LENGTH=182 /DNA_ID=CAMNT_0005512237 /DNA_START=358 /DNA_END=906 /DNA_ORIENTATION=-